MECLKATPVLGLPGGGRSTRFRAGFEAGQRAVRTQPARLKAKQMTSAWPARRSMEEAMINWWVYIPMAIFLAFSAAFWLIVKHADMEPGLSSANPTPPARAAVAPDTEDAAARQREAVGAR